MAMRDIAVGDVPVRALRVTFTGELGWELYCPTEYGLGLWRALWAAGEPHGLVAGGYRAIDALRLEKGYRVWGADVTPDDTPAEAFAREDDVDARRFLRCIVLDDPRAIALGNEPVLVAGEVAGRVTSGGYGYAVGKSIAYAYLPPTVGIGTPVEVDVFGEIVTGDVVAEPLWDPKGERLRG